MSKGLNELCSLSGENARAKGFDDVNVGTQLMLIVTELAEAMEDHRNGSTGNDVWFENRVLAYDKNGAPLLDKDGKHVKAVVTSNTGPGKPCGLASEVADVLIRTFDFCHRFSINAEKIVSEKMDYNKSREFLHGKKL